MVNKVDEDEGKLETGQERGISTLDAKIHA